MNFDSYTDCAVSLAEDLVNSEGSQDELPTVAALRAFLEAHEISSPGRLDGAVLEDVKALPPRLRAVWEAPSATEAAGMVNALLAESQALPQLTDHDGEAWHLHFSPPGAPLAVRLQAEAAMGLAAVLRGGGYERLRRCADDGCGDVFVDASRNRSRRYCDPDTCGNRANVAAYRARRRQRAG